MHTPRLTHAVNAADALLEHSRVPWQIHVDHYRGSVLQVQTDAAGIGRQKYAARRIVAKAVDKRAAFGAGHAAVKQNVTPIIRLTPANDELVRASPLTEDRSFSAGVLELLAKQRREFVGLCTVVRSLVEQIRAVAGHPHVLPCASENALIDIG
jgi:hypothetical protein